MNQVMVVCPYTKTFKIHDTQQAEDFIEHKLISDELKSINQPWAQNYAKLFYRSELVAGAIYLELYANATNLLIKGAGMQFNFNREHMRINGYVCAIVRDNLGRVHNCPPDFAKHLQSQFSFDNPQHSAMQATVLSMMKATLANS